MPTSSDFSPEMLEILRQRGIRPEDLTPVEQEKMSGGRAAISTLKGHAGGITGGGAGAMAGGAAGAKLGLLGGPYAPITVPVGTVLGAVVGGMVGGYSGQKIQDVVLPEELSQQLELEAAQAQEQHPIISGGTEIAASALASGGALSPRTLLRAGRGLVSGNTLSAVDKAALSQIGKEALSPEGVVKSLAREGDVAALKNVTLQAALNPAIDVGATLATEGELPDAKRLVSDIVGGALFSKPSFIGKKFGGMVDSTEPTPEPISKAGLSDIDIKNQPKELLPKEEQPLKLAEPTEIPKAKDSTPIVEPPLTGTKEVQPVDVAKAKELTEKGINPLTPEEQKAVEQELSGEEQTKSTYRVTVQQPQVPGDKGYVQIDEFRNGQNVRSSNPDTLNKEGMQIPSTEEFMKLPQGQYPLDEAKTKLGLKEKISSDVKSEEKTVQLDTTPAVKNLIGQQDSSKKGFLKSLEATFDKVDRESTTLGEAGRRWEARKDQFLGMRNIAIKDLDKYPSKSVNLVAEMRREAFRTGSIPRFTPVQQEINDILQSYYGKIADIRREIGLKINERTAGKSEYYVPDQLNDKTLDLFVNKATSPEAQYAKQLWAEHIYKESKGSLEISKIKEDINDYIAALGGQHNNYNSVKFGAIRRAQGYGLPEGLRESDAIKSLNKYGSRAASDLAMFMELESKPIIAASLKLNDPNTGKLVVHPESNAELSTSSNVRDMMKWVTDSFTGTMSQSTPKVNALVRLVNNSILGTATGLRDTVQMPVFALPYINKFSDLSAAMKGILNYRNEARNALATAANKPSIDKIQLGELNEAPDKFSALLNKAATVMRVAQGREAIEQFNREITFSVGKELARANVIGAKAGHKQSIDFLNRFGTLVDKNVTSLQGAELEAALNQIAKNFTDVNQGTYGGRGLPAGIIESQFAPFFALQKWSVEKSNVIYKDVVKPFLNGTNRLPLVTYTLGSVLSGTAIQQLNELLSGRKGQDPTLKEALSHPDPKTIIGELATLMQLASLGGIVGDTMKFASDIGLYGKTPRNIVSFPTATAVLDFQEKTTDMIEALKNGEDAWDVWKMYALDLLSHNIQTARLALNQTADKEEIQRKDKFRDVRVFNQMEGGKASDFPKTNEYLGIEQKEFKRTGNVQEAIQQLPNLIKQAIEQSQGDPYELMSKLKALKGNSFQTMPSPKDMPLKFAKYITHLQKTQGAEAASQRLQEYLMQGAVNQVKSQMVP